MAVDKRTIQSIQKSYEEKLPLMDVEAVKEEFLEWLASLKLPSKCEDRSWDEYVEVFPPDADEKKLKSGRRIRLAMRLYTSENRYVISLWENLAISARGVYTLSLHVLWKNGELARQENLEKGYTGNFKDNLRARHTLWAQTFTPGELGEALNACAVAILGNEIIDKPTESEENKVQFRNLPRVVSFPTDLDQ